MAQLAARKPRGNLPAELTSFVGRRRELAAIRSTLSDARLLTLTGAGGVGKTRLALHAGRELSRTLPDGVWLVELQELRNANLLPTVIMTALGMRDQSGRSSVWLLVGYLEDNEAVPQYDAAVSAPNTRYSPPNVVDRLLGTWRSLRGRVWSAPSMVWTWLGRRI